MSSNPESRQGFLSRYKKYLIALVLLYVILTPALVLLSLSDRVPFDYQVF
jgi:hypothetical protein